MINDNIKKTMTTNLVKDITFDIHETAKTFVDAFSECRDSEKWDEFVSILFSNNKEVIPADQKELTSKVLFDRYLDLKPSERKKLLKVAGIKKYHDCVLYI